MVSSYKRQAINGKSWPIHNGLGWSTYTQCTEGEYMLQKLEMRNMRESISNLLRKYSDIIVEAEGNARIGSKEEFPEDPAIEHGKEDQFWDDNDLKNEDDAIASFEKETSSDPVSNLADYLHDGVSWETPDTSNIDEIKRAIQTWLNQNKYELTPIGGLTNTTGAV